jgi:hypothetical protein
MTTWHCKKAGALRIREASVSFLPFRIDLPPSDTFLRVRVQTGGAALRNSIVQRNPQEVD